LSDGELAACEQRLHQPQPRIELGLALRGIAHSAIDVSDGLLADLGHILECSNVGAEIDFAMLPVSQVLRLRSQQKLALHGGDDYELCFTAPAERAVEVHAIAERLGLPLTRIGKIVAGRGCIVQDASGNPLHIETEGYDHFR
jgi:thiamine-monophosphate kinase